MAYGTIDSYLYWILFGIISLASWIVSRRVESKFKKYQEEPLTMTGAEVAEKMLRDNDIMDVKVECMQGFLTDHYNPVTKTVTLSQEVYNGKNVAAAAVAAHECGHALQHNHAYAPLQMRTALVPVVNFSSKIMVWVLLAGMLLIETVPQILLGGIVLFAITTLFSFITLPVEINASRRAVAWLESAGITERETTKMASDALRSAAYTYVVAALSSLATLVYYILVFMGGNRK